MELEAAALTRAAAAGAPVPHVLVARRFGCRPWQSVPGLRLHRRRDDRAPNSTRARRRVARQPASTQCADALAAIHRADPAGIGLTSSDPLDEWHAQLDEMGDTTATFEWAFRWLGGAPATADAEGVGARRLPDGQPDHRHRRRARPGSRRCSTGSSPTPARSTRTWRWFCIRAWRFGAPPSLGRGRARQRRGLPARLRAGLRHRARPGRDALVAGPVHAALGRHLPLPGRATPVGPDAIRRTGRDRPPRLRDRVRPARRCWRRRHDRPARPTHGGRTGGGRRGVPRDRRPRGTSGAVNFHARVAANVLRTVERELLDDNAARTAGRAAASPTNERSRPRSARGELDDRGPEVLPALRALVLHRLAVSHPGYEQRVTGLSRAGPAPATRARRAWFRRARRGPRSAASPPRRGKS